MSEYKFNRRPEEPAEPKIEPGQIWADRNGDLTFVGVTGYVRVYSPGEPECEVNMFENTSGLVGLLKAYGAVLVNLEVTEC